QKQQELEDKKTELDKERGDANALLKQLNDETGNYTEYLEDNKAAMAEVDAAIEAAEDKYEEQTPPATEPPTQKPDSGGSSGSGGGTTSGGSGSGTISLTYPVPSQTTITCAFG